MRVRFVRACQGWRDRIDGWLVHRMPPKIFAKPTGQIADIDTWNDMESFLLMGSPHQWRNPLG